MEIMMEKNWLGRESHQEGVESMLFGGWSQNERMLGKDIGRVDERNRSNS